MEPTLILFVIRLVSAALLLGVIAAVFTALWRDFQARTIETAAQRRIYGRLVRMTDSAGDPAAQDSEIAYPLLPLTTIGRSQTNTIPIDDDYVSGEHALLALRHGQWWLEDRGSRNGTSVNGLIVTRPIVVTDGDEIIIGKHRFQIDLE
jgi:hypothetical protein